MRAKAILSILLLPLMLGFATPAHAVDPWEILDDPALEERARDISAGLRCLVCQNQSIDDSDAQLARDLRVLVRERLVAGDADDAVVDYVVSRYGDYVLLKPPVKASTYALWFGPVIIVGFGLLATVMVFRRKPDAAPSTASDTASAQPATRTPLNAKEQRRLSELLGENDQHDDDGKHT